MELLFKKDHPRVIYKSKANSIYNQAWAAFSYFIQMSISFIKYNF